MLLTRRPFKIRSTPLSLGLLSAIVAVSGCTENKYFSEITNVYPGPDSGTDEPPLPPPPLSTDSGADADSGTPPVDPGDPDGGMGPEDPDAELLVGAPVPNTSPKDFDADVFGTPGNRYWFAVTPAQVEKMNNGRIFFDDFPGGGDRGDIYTPGGEGDKTFANRLLVTKVGKKPVTADFGKVEVRVVGQSTHRPWTTSSIPNLKVDTNEFQKKHEINGVEHLRFNNGLVGSIFREKLTLDIFKALNYPAPRATYAWVSSNVWGPEIAIPYTLVEVYKRGFCRRQGEAWGGDCENMWEFVGDLDSIADSPENCQLKQCDNTRAEEFRDAVMQTPPGEGFKDALAEWIDWDSFHEFQCLSWMLWIGDDALHNENNVVIVERSDGLFQYLPYSVDISAGQDWYEDVPLYGQNSIARGCQADESCWADTIQTCENMVGKFKQIKPVKMVEDLYTELETLGMLRPGDEGRFDQLKSWYERRVEELSDELETFREMPAYCEWPDVPCGDTCISEWEECDQCPVDPGERDAGAGSVEYDAGSVESDAGVAPGPVVAAQGDVIIIDPPPRPGPVEPGPICEPRGGKPEDPRPFDAYKIRVE